MEIDGGYHDYIYENYMSRQQKIKADGWDVIRFSNEDVLEERGDCCDSDCEAPWIEAGVSREETNVTEAPSPQPSPPKIR